MVSSAFAMLSWLLPRFSLVTAELSVLIESMLSHATLHKKAPCYIYCCGVGIGGDAFCLYFDAKTKKVSALLGNGGAPGALTLQVQFVPLDIILVLQEDVTVMHEHRYPMAELINGAPVVED